MNPITALVSVPYGRDSKHRLFTFSDRMCALHNGGSQEVFLFGPDGVGKVSGTDMSQQGYERWATTIFEGRVYFSNLSTPIHVVTEAPYVLRLGGQNVRVPPTIEIPRAKYLETFFDHLFAANVNYKGEFPARVLNSGLRNFGDWEPNKNNEADYYDIIESEGGHHAGITGMGRLSDRLYVYTSNSIWVADYVGLPNLFRWSMAVKDIGNEFPYAMVNVGAAHFFISDSWRNFGYFDGQSVPQPVGDPIASYFFSELTADPIMRYWTWGYVDKEEREVVWCFVPKGADQHTREIVYSLNYKTWYARQARDYHSFCGRGRFGKTIHQTAGTIDSQLGAIDALGFGNLHGKLWGSSQARLFDSNLVATTGTEPPCLETHDYTYGDLQAVKEVESICVQASSVAPVTVWVGVRNNVDDLIMWQPLPQTWTKSLPEGRLSVPRTSGRIIRWRFTPYGNYDKFKWYTFIENVYGAKQVEK